MMRLMDKGKGNAEIAGILDLGIYQVAGFEVWYKITRLAI